MDVRIDTAVVGSTTVVRVSGRLCDAAVEELRAACSSLPAAFEMDLSSLAWADPEGLSAIRALIRDGTPTRGLSPFMRLMLEEPTEEEHD
jgi:hypothetical protein